MIFEAKRKFLSSEPTMGAIAKVPITIFLSIGEDVQQFGNNIAKPEKECRGFGDRGACLRTRD
jgi:hypothetical protein